ncbi:estradiol 17-beta-dehydrogenase 1 isoform X1 [Phasianus colchicus]|uniref:estradiol 17-beta-dehydrogenase 1 isoform X1 n=1 Tax=Phasianus colchicus TaxID=9054 RepID=UPI00129E3B1A|nr:estradiol 17-beta-dehydrogenase 1 isoform X1 [Phasianus colchicus]
MERTSVPMEKTTVLITGCSSGIGLGLAVRLAADATRRFKVFATMRDLAKGEQLLERLGGRCPDTLELLQLDVTDPHSLAAAVRCMRGQHPDVLGTASPLGHSRERVPIWGWAWMALQPWGWACWGTERRIRAGFPHPRIQTVLGLCDTCSPAPYPTVCNAGVGLMAPLEMCSEQAMRAVFEVNVFGTARTIQAFLPAMKRRRAGRILVSSSIGGLQGVPFNAVYCASKFALEGLCESLAIVLRPFNIHMTLVECGPVHTAFMDNARRADPEGHELRALDAETQQLYRRYLQHCAQLFLDAAQEVDEVLQVFLEAIAAPRPPLRCITARLPAPLARLRPGGPDGADYVRAMHDFVFGPGEAAEEQP